MVRGRVGQSSAMAAGAVSRVAPRIAANVFFITVSPVALFLVGHQRFVRGANFTDGGFGFPGIHENNGMQSVVDRRVDELRMLRRKAGSILERSDDLIRGAARQEE